MNDHGRRGAGRHAACHRHRPGGPSLRSAAGHHRSWVASCSARSSRSTRRPVIYPLAQIACASSLGEVRFRIAVAAHARDPVRTPEGRTCSRPLAVVTLFDDSIKYTTMESQERLSPPCPRSAQEQSARGLSVCWCRQAPAHAAEPDCRAAAESRPPNLSFHLAQLKACRAGAGCGRDGRSLIYHGEL